MYKIATLLSQAENQTFVCIFFIKNAQVTIFSNYSAFKV